MSSEGVEEQEKIERILKDKGFTYPDAPRDSETELAGGMNPGEFKVLTYTPSEVVGDERKKGMAHSVLYKIPGPGNFYLVRRLESDEVPAGWTTSEADALIRSILKDPNEGGNYPEEVLMEMDTRVQNRGFKELNPSSVSDRTKAFFESMTPGEFFKLSYPEAEQDKDPRKKGVIHTVLYVGSDSRWFKRRLHSPQERREFGWTSEEAQALVSNIRREIGQE